MHPATVKKVLSNEETLDVAQTAEAVREDIRRRQKKDKPTSLANSLRAHMAWKARQKEKEEFRQKLKEIWNRRKKS
jgi:hypothetical protein